MSDEEEERPNPDDLLKSIQLEEKQQSQGKLKIFLGMAAGVGKTYAMLEAARALKAEGADVVVGVIDTHGRPETAKLLEGLEIIPEKWVKYKDSVFEELDLDEVLKRKPQIVLVDELAHSNVPGSRHPKRWQDVAEILDHGIDVYTTLNVQHIESLKDVVEHIAGISIRETVPDLIVDRANYIELVDLTPNELRQRLREGKVYLGDQSVIAAQNFFQEDRLTALREIVLRYAAEKVDHELKEMVTTSHWADGWKPRERLLVAVSHSPHSQKLIRITRRLAFNLGAPWIAVHVDDGRILDDTERETLAKNLALSRDLGAEVITTTAPDIAQALQRIARQKSVTQIIIGRAPSSWYSDFFQRNPLLDRLARECSDIDLHVIRQSMYPKPPAFKLRFHLKESLYSYFLVLLCVLFLTLFNWFFLPTVGYKISGYIFLLGILFLSLFFRKGPILFGSVLYAVIWTILFIPNWGKGIEWNEDFLLLVFYFLTAVFTGILTDRARRNKEMLIKRERSIAALYEIVKEIAASPSFNQVFISVKDRLSSVLDGKCEIILKQMDNGIVFDENISFFNNENEKAAANWTFQNGKEAGWSTSTLSSSQNLYIPLKGRKEIMGVLAFHPSRDNELTIEEKNFLYTVTQLLASYYERHMSVEKARKLEHHQQIEKIYESILILISNLFEGPLVTIQNAVKELKKGQEQISEKGLINPTEQIETATESLIRILDNITAMVNLSAGLTPINIAKYDIGELVTTCCETIQKAAAAYKWSLKIEEDLPKVNFDYELIELLFFNLAFHAMEFSLPDSTIEIEAKSTADFVLVSVAGTGQTIPPEMVDVAFEKFYRLPGTASTGLGLGLAIAKAIAEVHNGHLTVQNRPEGGMLFTLLLPIASAE